LWCAGRSYRYQGAKVVIRDGERVLEWIEMEPVVVLKGDLRMQDQVVVRVHDQCFTSEVMGSKRCDCKEQLELALDYINANGGALIYMPQEGRGIGLANKVAAYRLQDAGADTVDANRLLGFGDDERSYACVPFILDDIGARDVQLMTNNPMKVRELSELGVNIVSTKPAIVPPNPYNEGYLRTKALRMAHALSFDGDRTGGDPLTVLRRAAAGAGPKSSSAVGAELGARLRAGAQGGAQGSGAADEAREGEADEAREGAGELSVVRAAAALQAGGAVLCAAPAPPQAARRPASPPRPPL
jgi:GTP cyclohydrolase II